MELNKIYQGDCLDVLPTLPDNSVDSIVTDPPYHLASIVKRFGKEGSAPAKFGTDGAFKRASTGFMGKTWDGGDIAFNPEMWKECLRVLKPGGYLLSFSGTRTYHRMASAIEDAGFEVRDMIEWVYGQGFPKSLNIGKAIDKKPKADSVKDWKKWLDIQINNSGKSKQQINDECGFTATSYVKTDNKDYWSSNLPKNGKWRIMKKVIGIKTDEYDWVEQDNCEERGYVEPTGGLAGGSGNTVGCFTGKQLSNNAIDDRAKQWEGWGTALKPAHEPICMARKPLAEKTVAENCLKWGTGGINIDESRIPTSETLQPSTSTKMKFGGNSMLESSTMNDPNWKQNTQGRFPANLIHDNSEEVRECFPESKSIKSNRGGARNDGTTVFNKVPQNIEMNYECGFNDSGNASRFFKSIIYTAKASKSERNKGCEGLYILKDNTPKEDIEEIKHLLSI